MSFDDYFMKYLPIPASTLKFTCILVRHMTVWPLLRLFARSWRLPTISEYKWDTMEPLKHSSDQLIGRFYHTTPYSAKTGATTAKRRLLSPRAAHIRRAATKPVCWVCRRGRFPLWMAAVKRRMREEDGSPCWGFYGRSGETSISAFPQDPAGSL